MNFKNPFAADSPLDAASATTPGAETPDAAPTFSAAQLEAITAERDQLLLERAELNDRLLRRTAEFDNFRRRTDREKQEYFEYAGMETVRQLLPVLDDFERAIKLTRQTKPEEAEREFFKGTELIYNRLLDTVKKLGLEPISSEGALFDPNLHEAIERVPTDEAEDQTIVGEFQRGYTFKGKLLRPAMVKVAVGQ